MTIFEYLTVAVSIILGLGLSKLVSAIPFVFGSKGRDWLHILFFILLFVSHIVVWWNIWLLNSISDWNIFQFAILMGSPLSMYLAATALVSIDPSQVSDWKRHLANQSGWLFSAMAATVGFGILRGFVVATNYNPSWFFFLFFAVWVFGAFSHRRSVHASLAILAYVMLAYVISTNLLAS